MLDNKFNYFTKNETVITVLCIIIYVLSNSFCSQNFGVMDYRTLIVNLIILLLIIIFVLKNKLGFYLGLMTFPKAKEFLYFIPLFLIISVNFFNGVNINHSVSEIIIFMLSMFCVGFLEEIIFRGFLYKLLAKDNIKRAMIVTSLTFAAGHIINLLNGQNFVQTLLQVCYSFSIGYLFAIILVKGKSLWPSIITHMLFNALSIFYVETDFSLYIISLILISISVIYSIYLKK